MQQMFAEKQPGVHAKDKKGIAEFLNEDQIEYKIIWFRIYPGHHSWNLMA